MNETFLIVSLFIPRLTLLYFYFTGLVPFNTVPFAADLMLSAFVPRLLILFYIIENQGYSNWFWVHLVAWILVSTITYKKST